MESILANRVLLIPLAAWCIAQVLKVIIVLIWKRRLNLSLLIGMGGMPSAHSTLVCCLATTTAIIYGLGSAIFAVTAFLAGIVMYDAAGMRQQVSIQSNILNRMLDELFKEHPMFEQRLREFIGHTRLQVLAGALLGILIAYLLV